MPFSWRPYTEAPYTMLGSLLLVIMTFALLVAIFSTAPEAFAEDGKLETVEDCEFWTTQMVMSRSSGARGHIISGKLENQRCYYSVRLFLGGNLRLVENMRDYELVLAPKKEKRAAEVQAPNPEDYVKNLDFGN